MDLDIIDIDPRAGVAASPIIQLFICPYLTVNYLFYEYVVSIYDPPPTPPPPILEVCLMI